MNKAIFLDRDGVINHDPGDYTTCLEEFHILPDAIPAMKKMQDEGYLIVVITNQGGVAKGLYTLEEVNRIHDFFISECRKASVEITDIYFSPHHESTGKSLTRKPGSLMIERALAQHNIDPDLSFMIGDKNRDLEAAAGAGVPGLVMPVNGSLLEAFDKLVVAP